ncbi:MAG TPA: sigma-54 dependent transcriptional regulator [Thermodesulfovibrionales bacterium]|nr:sigma-54 dependent transcriptional regulator [Thermodesulfovibrionales bacterium]
MSSPLLLIIEDDETILLSLRVFFEGRDYTVLTMATGKEGLEAAFREIPDTVILDLRLPDSYGIDILKEIKQHHPEIPVIIMSGVGEVDEAVTAMKSGAEYYFQKPVSLDELSVLVDKCIGIRQMKEEASFYRETDHPVIGRSPHIQGLIQMMSLLGSNPLTTVLILGETGTGKELVARNIHALSSRAGRPFVDINCAAIPEHILESELFGYEAGAFTDAKKTKKGLFELAEGGTLFLDEIGDMPPGAQAKILRVIETKTLKRLGGTRDITVDVRVMAATNRDLMERVKNGSFREDLYYRLNVMPLQLLPLRDRPQDIPLVAEFLLEEIKKTLGRKDVGVLAADAMDALMSYAWPGNVRELKNVIERATILCRGGNISVRHIILPQANGHTRQGHVSLALADMERSHIRHVLHAAEGNRTKAAKLLGIARSTLNEKIKQYQIN